MSTLSLTSAFGLLLRRDLTLAYRRRAELVNPLLFFVLVTSLFPLGIGSDPRLIQAVGPGVIYSILSYAGLALAPAAYAGVFSNGTLPIFTAAIAFFLMRQKPGARALIGIAVILAGSALLGLYDLENVGAQAWLGAALFLTSSVVISLYTVGVRLWTLSPRQALSTSWNFG